MPNPLTLLKFAAEASLRGERIFWGTDNDGVILPISCPTIDPSGLAAVKAQMTRLDGAIITGRDAPGFLSFAEAGGKKLKPAIISTNHGAELVIIQLDGTANSLLLVDGLTATHQTQIEANVAACKAKTDEINALMGFPAGHCIIVEEKTTYDGETHLGYTVQVRAAMEWISVQLDSAADPKAFITPLLENSLGNHNAFTDYTNAQLKAEKERIAKAITEKLEAVHFHPLVRSQVEALPGGVFAYDEIECDTGVKLAGDIHKGKILTTLLTEETIAGVENPLYKAGVKTHVIYTGDDFGGTDGHAREAGLALKAAGSIESYTTIQVAREGKTLLTDEADVVVIHGSCELDRAANPEKLNFRACAEHGRLKAALEAVIADPAAFLAIADKPAELATFLARYQLTGPHYPQAPAATATAMATSTTAAEAAARAAFLAQGLHGRGVHAAKSAEKAAAAARRFERMRLEELRAEKAALLAAARGQTSGLPAGMFRPPRPAPALKRQSTLTGEGKLVTIEEGVVEKGEPTAAASAPAPTTSM